MLAASPPPPTTKEEAQAYPSGIRQFKGSSAYSAITNGNLVVAAGVSGVAKDKDDYLIYETSSDLLYYEADGNGSGAAVGSLSNPWVPSGWCEVLSAFARLPTR